ncbi:MAG: murein hydrolase activator EnvC [Pseudohongiellaceae bacterium]
MITRTPALMLLVAIFTGNFGISTGHGQSSQQGEQAQRDLEAVATAIEDIRSWLGEASENQSREEQALREADLKLARLSALTTNTRVEVKSIGEELAKLEQQSAQLEVQKAEQEAVISQLLRAAYRRGESGFLQNVFGTQSINSFQRTLRYTEKLSQFQLQKIAQFEATLTQIEEAEIVVAEKLETMNQQDAILLGQMADLESARSQKQNILKSLRTSIAAKDQELNELEANQAELQQLVEQIRIAMEGVSSFADVPPIRESKGQLPPPIDGSIRSGFGQTYGDGSLQRQGIIWQVETGTAVTAIHPGQVVFSDWLRGSGLLLIVDHGDGYMSLYGNNEALSASAGDWVDSGDVLATSGTLPSSGEAGLYFEIRHRGQPQDPVTWLNLGR